MKRFGFVVALALFGIASKVWAQAPGALELRPNLIGQLERPLRYRPEGTDFVIENGAEFFNRPLYGGNTAFRVDAGDRPEFTLYLPGRGGNLRLGLKSSAGVKWLHRAERIVARYRPGTMLYEVRDPLLGSGGTLRLTAIALPMTEGLIVQLEAKAIPDGVELIWAYGGASGERGRRDGDIGTENVPIGEYFQLQPKFCAGNAFTLDAEGFTLRSKPATILGLMPAGATLTVADAQQWDAPEKLFTGSPPAAGAASKPFATPVVAGRVSLTSGQPIHLVLQRVAEDATTTTGADLDTYREVTAPRPGETRAAPKLTLLPAFHRDDLPRVFAESEAYFAALRTRVTVETPDAFINAAVASLNVAADAVWDEPQRAIMHGAIAWRTKLLGWRGPYLLDALGWHDRAREHFASWASKQNVSPIPEKIPPADAASNLSRNEAGLHSNGDLSNSHYDMNLVYIDALFRHLRWTGDLEFARTVWPTIERHLAWERRLFRREFGAEKLPLYEAYAAIWASDDLQYSGGGTAHASAYNLFHNRMAYRFAGLLGKNQKPYLDEATGILRAMHELLWTKDHFAESKDLLGRQLVHPSAALWSVYHVIDAEVFPEEETRAMCDYVKREIPFLPVTGPGVPTDDHYGVFATSNWLPYSWSINNVVMGENIHAALAFWQAGEPEDAFRLTKSSLLASMFMGVTPGNVGSMNYLDVYRRESQRDFADGSGVLSRAIVEGLFGIRPDALPAGNVQSGGLPYPKPGEGQLRIAPGFPATWDHAKIDHPQVKFEYRRDGARETFQIKSSFSRPMLLQLEIPWRGESAEFSVNGEKVIKRDRLYSGRRLVIRPMNSRETTTVVVDWRGKIVEKPSVSTEEWDSRNVEARLRGLDAPDWTKPAKPESRWETIDLAPIFNDRVTEIFKKGKYLSPRSPYASLALPSQGIGAWAGHVNEMAEIDDRGLRAAAAANGGRIVLPNGVSFATPGAGEAKNVLFTSQWDNYPREASVPVSGRARRAYLLMAGSTNFMQSRLDNGEVVVNYGDGTSTRLALRNPETWWPIEQDYFIDDYQFRDDAPLPARVNLKTGQVRVLDAKTFKGQGRKIDGGAATVLVLPLDFRKKLQSITVRALANDVVIGLMAVTLDRGERD